MEANFFRFAAAELFNKVRGSRIQKIYMPGFGIYTLDLGRVGYLILACSRKGGFFYLSATKPANPSQPPAHAMWLRKHVKNRRILDMINVWPQRRILLQLSAPDSSWLVLDLVQGLHVVDCPDQSQERDPSWPGLETVLHHEEVWVDHPQLSPPLRSELAGRSPDEARRLLDLLAMGKPEGFFICRRTRGGSVLSCFRMLQSPDCQEFDSALEAAAFFSKPRLESLLNAPREKELQKLEKKKTRKLEKSLSQVHQDRRRLQEMVELGEKGRLIQANLYRLDPEQKIDVLKLEDSRGRVQEIALDKSKTLRENMQWYFKRASKGKRGLQVAAARETWLLNSGIQARDGSGADTFTAGPKPREISNSRVAAKAHVFRSSDGYLILRARNSRVAGDLLRDHSSGFDYWLHAQDGPGAHTVLKRQSKEEAVPRRSLEEAAALAALASFQKHEHKARVILALVKDVRPVKGAPGRVKVEKQQESLVVELDPGLEPRLRLQQE